MSRPELDACRNELGCASEVHLSTCPHHPGNISTITLPAEDFDRLLEQLDEPPADMPRLRELMARRTRFEESE